MYGIKAIKKYRTVYKNYINVMWSVYRKKEKIKVILRNGKTSKLNYIFAWFYSTLIFNKNINMDPLKLNDSNLIFSYKGKTITLLEPWGDLSAVFVNEEYQFLDVKNEIVIDVGANVGDSPIYFAISNAKKVIALEPYPYSYNIALENIKINNLEDKITLLNAGYGKNGITYVDPNFKNGTGSNLKQQIDGTKIKILSLKTLLDDYNIENGLLKMDCEGCEYNILNEDNDTLRKFKRIQIEYHYGYEKIKKKLEEVGFNIKYTKPRKSYNQDVNKTMEVGYIFGELII